MAAYLKTITSSFVNSLNRSTAGFLPWHLSQTKRRGSHLYGSFIKQYSSGDLIHGSKDWQMIRPATPEELSYEKFHRNYSRQGLGVFVFNSRKPLSEEIWRKALRHATNKIEVLRMCLHEREKKLWLCEVKNHNIDFKIIENKMPLEVIEDLQNEGLDHSFWSVRIVPADDGEVQPIPDIKKMFPHQYNLLFKFHHGLIDAMTIGYILRVYTEILDDVLSGKIVNEDIQFGKFILENPLQMKIKETQQALDNGPLHLDDEKERMQRVTMKQPFFYSAFPKPKAIQSKTHHIVRKVDNAQVNTLYKCCKSNNLNMTAGFEAVINTALVEMVKDAGFGRDGYKINIRQNINMRRYMDVEKEFRKFPLGNLLGGMQQDAYCRSGVREHFWEHAQEIHKTFHSLLNKNGPIIEGIVRPQVQGPLDPEVLGKGPPQDNSDYAFSNVLDVTSFVFYEGTQVQLTKIITINYINKFLHPMLFQFSTYRGIGQLTCSYDTAKVADDTAHEIMERIMNVLDFVTK